MSTVITSQPPVSPEESLPVKPPEVEGENTGGGGGGGPTTAATTTTENANFDVLDSAANVQSVLEDVDAKLLNARSTGVLFGGNLTNLGAAVARFAAGVGELLNNSDPANPTYERIAWAQTDIDLSGPNSLYYVFVDATGTFQTTTVKPDVDDFRLNIYLWRISVRGGEITGTQSLVQPLQQYGPQIRDAFEAIGNVKLGLGLSAAATDLSFSIAAGSAFDPGSNFYTNPLDPHKISFTEQAPATFRHTTADGTQSADRTQLDVANYDVGNVITAIPGANSRAQIFTVRMFPGSGNVRVFYGQEFFTTVAEALAALQSGEHNPTFPETYSEALTLGWVVASKAAVNLADSVQKIVTSNKFGVTGGSAGADGQSVTITVAADQAAFDAATPGPLELVVLNA